MPFLDLPLPFPIPSLDLPLPFPLPFLDLPLPFNAGVFDLAPGFGASEPTYRVGFDHVPWAGAEGLGLEGISACPCTPALFRALSFSAFGDTSGVSMHHPVPLMPPLRAGVCVCACTAVCVCVCVHRRRTAPARDRRWACSGPAVGGEHPAAAAAAAG